MLRARPHHSPLSPRRLETASQCQHQMQSRPTLEVVLGCHLVVRPESSAGRQQRPKPQIIGPPLRD